MAFPERFLDELLAKTDLLELVRAHTPVERRGTRWLARCPFHSEKTPSFNVTPEKGMFYCFGCHAGGTALQFVMRSENLAYAEAVALLANRAGMALPEQEDTSGQLRRDRLLDIYRLAARFYYDCFLAPEGEAARAYAQTRGIRPGTARRFGLGFAPDAWDSLDRALSAKGVSGDELRLSGLVTRNRRGGQYDAFRNRLMFPVFNLTGQVIAFSGRALDDSPAKYKNSPETPVYQKRSALYAAQLARKSPRPFWILCEGNMDALMLHQNGYDNAVATCGTALTEMQARLIARHTAEVILSYDSDAAGLNATRKAIGLLESAGLAVRVLSMEGAKDPDEYLLKYGAEAFERLLTNSTNHIEYRLRLLEGDADLSADAGKIAYLKKAVSLLADLPGRTERQVYAGRVAAKLGVKTDGVLADTDALRRKRGQEEKREAGKQILRPLRLPDAPAEEQVLSILLPHPELLAKSGLTEDLFRSDAAKKLFSLLREGVSPLTADVTQEVSSLAVRLSAYPPLPDPGGAEEALRAGEQKLRESVTLRRAAEAGGSDDALRALYEYQKKKQNETGREPDVGGRKEF